MSIDRIRAIEAAVVQSARSKMASFAMLMRPAFGKLPKFQALICEALDRVAVGLCSRLIIALPPQHGKSELVSRLFPPYLLGLEPSAKIIMASYSHGLVSLHSRDAREIMRHPRYQSIFPEAALSRDSQAVERWETNAGGRVIASGREGAITGHSADLIIADDLLSGREEAESPVILEKVWDFWVSGLLSRTHGGSRVILIGTRWSVGDPIGRVLSGPGGHLWEVLHLPAIAEDCDPLGRMPGEALWPERHPAELLEMKRLEGGDHEFQSLYQGRPFARGGQYVRRSWFGEVLESDVPPGLSWTRGLDLAVSVKRTADYTASVKVAKHGNTIYVSGGWFRRAEWPTVKAIVCAQAKNERAVLAIEAVAGFDVAFRELKDQLSSYCVVRKVNATRDKLTRALPWIAEAESGRIVLVRTGDAGRDAWIGEFLSQCDAFPSGGAHDDLVDALSIAYESGFRARASVASW